MGTLLKSIPALEVAGVRWEAENVSVSQRTRRVACDCETPCDFQHRKAVSGSKRLTVRMRPAGSVAQ
jgi:hypothetical protein